MRTVQNVNFNAQFVSEMIRTPCKNGHVRAMLCRNLYAFIHARASNVYVSSILFSQTALNEIIISGKLKFDYKSDKFTRKCRKTCWPKFGLFSQPRWIHCADHTRFTYKNSIRSYRNHEVDATFHKRHSQHGQMLWPHATSILTS